MAYAVLHTCGKCTQLNANANNNTDTMSWETCSISDNDSYKPIFAEAQEKLSPCGVDQSSYLSVGHTPVLLLSWLSESQPRRVDLWLPHCTQAHDGGRPEISASHPRTASACIPVMCQLLRMRSNCTVGKGPRGPRVLRFPCASPLFHPGHTAKPSRIFPPWPIYHHLTVTPLDVQVHPYVWAIRSVSSPQKLSYPLTASDGFHIPRAAGTG